MANTFKSLQIKRYPKVGTRQTKEENYWKKYQFPVVVKEYSGINHVDFCQCAPHDFMVTCSAKIQVFSPTTNQVRKTITRFKENAYSAKFRADGDLITAGFEDGSLKVFDASNRSILRHWKPHTKAVHVAGFVSGTSYVYSASDDKTLRCSDIPTQKDIACFKGHVDYIRAGACSISDSNIIITGSYDHTVKLWDIRANKSTLTVDHGDPVESVLLYPNCGMCISSGSNRIKVWDVFAGGKLLFNVSNHSKSITAMCFDGSYTRLLSGSIDRHVKVYDTQDFSVVSSLDYPSAILSIGISPTGSHLVVGMADGLISIKERAKKKEPETSFVEMREPPTRGTYRYFIRGQSYKPQEGDHVVEQDKPRKYSKTDTLLKSFEYREALDSVLVDTQVQPPKVISLLLELARRDALKQALSNRTADSLMPIMAFLTKNICNPRYASILTDVMEIILDIYTPIIGKSKKTDKVFAKLRQQLSNELLYQTQAMEVLGSLDTLFCASVVPRTSNLNSAS
eukprot:gene9625-10610_t